MRLTILFFVIIIVSITFIAAQPFFFGGRNQSYGRPPPGPMQGGRHGPGGHFRRYGGHNSGYAGRHAFGGGGHSHRGFDHDRTLMGPHRGRNGHIHSSSHGRMHARMIG